MDQLERSPTLTNNMLKQSELLAKKKKQLLDSEQRITAAQIKKR